MKTTNDLATVLRTTYSGIVYNQIDLGVIT